MPQETKADQSSDVDANLEHHTADASDPVALARAVALAVDYRGDVTVTVASTGQVLDCYAFDLKHADDRSRALLRAIPKGDEARVEIPVRDIAAIAFTGRDTAAGKSFDTWMRKYVARKLAGKQASIESESLE